MSHVILHAVSFGGHISGSPQHTVPQKQRHISIPIVPPVCNRVVLWHWKQIQEHCPSPLAFCTIFTLLLHVCGLAPLVLIVLRLNFHLLDHIFFYIWKYSYIIFSIFQSLGFVGSTIQNGHQRNSVVLNYLSESRGQKEQNKGCVVYPSLYSATTVANVSGRAIEREAALEASMLILCIPAMIGWLWSFLPRMGASYCGIRIPVQLPALND